MTVEEANKLAPIRALLRCQQVQARTGLPRSSLYKLIAEGKFPPAFPLAGRAVAWDSRAVDAWVQSRIPATV